jgi:hypothetical protein
MPQTPGTKLVLIVALHNMHSVALSRIRDRGQNTMRPSDRHQPRRREERRRLSLATWLPVFAAVALMIAGCLSTFLFLQLDAFRPKVGDIVAFKPGSQDTEMWQITIPATSISATGSPTAECSLDPNVMAANGGSLVVESVEERSLLRYHIHWAGSATAKANGDCGTSANLLVSRTDLQRLANAAGGFGVGEKGIVR